MMIINEENLAWRTMPKELRDDIKHVEGPFVLDQVRAAFQLNEQEKKNYESVKAAVRCLHKYADLGFDLGENDRLDFVEKLWNVVYENETNDIGLQTKCIQTISELLQRKFRDLRGKIPNVVPWKQVMHVLRKIHFPEETVLAHPKTGKHLDSLFTMIRTIRWYYESASPTTAIVADEVVSSSTMNNDISLIDPNTTSSVESLLMMDLFFPNCVSNAVGKYAKQWLEIWSLYDMSTVNSIFFSLFVRAFKYDDGGYTYGLGDELSPSSSLEPENIHILFSHIQNSLLLSSSSSSQSLSKGSSGVISKLLRSTSTKIAKLSIHLLAFQPSVVSDLLSRLLFSMRTHFHPSNMSSNDSLSNFLVNLCASLAKRMGTNRPIPVETVKRLILDLLPLIEMTLYSKSTSVQLSAQRSLKHLAFLAPKTIGDWFVPIILSALDPENLTKTHQAPAAMKAVTSLIRPLRKYLEPHLPNILRLCLPGIDPNDSNKSLVTLTMIQLALAGLTSKDDESALSSRIFQLDQDSHMDDDEYEEENDGENKEFMEQWILDMFDRFFLLAENQPVREKSGMGGYLETVLHLCISNAFDIIQTLPIKNQSIMVNKISSFLSSRCLPNAIRFAKVAARFCAALDSSLAFKQLLPKNGVLPVPENLAIWNLAIVGGLVRNSSEQVSNHKDVLLSIVDQGLNHEKPKVRKLAGTLLRRILRSLLCVYTIHATSREWESVVWHIPSSGDISLAQSISKRYLDMITLEIDDLIQTKNSFSSLLERWRKVTRVLFQLSRGLATHLQDSFPAGVTYFKPSMKIADRSTLVELTMKALQFNRLSKGNIASIRTCLKTLGELTLSFGPQTTDNRTKDQAPYWALIIGLDASRSVFGHTKKIIQYRERKDCNGTLPEDAKYDKTPWFVMVIAQYRYYVRTKYLARSCAEGKTPKDVMSTLLESSQDELSDIRGIARSRLNAVVFRHPWSEKNLVEDLILDITTCGTNNNTLDADTRGARVLGSLAVLNAPHRMRMIATKPGLLSLFVLNVMQISLVIDALPPAMETKCQPLFNSIVSEVLSRCSVVGDIPNRDRIFTEMQDSSLPWRRKIIASSILTLLGEPPAWEWFSNGILSDMMPLKLVSVGSLAKMMILNAPFGESPALKKIFSQPEILKSLIYVLGEDRSTTKLATVDGSSKAPNWSAGIAELIRYSKRQVCNWPKAHHSRSSSVFSPRKSQFWELCFRLVSPAALVPVLGPVLEHALFEQDGRDQMLARIVAAEIFAGSMHFPEMLDLMTRLIPRILTDVTGESALVWIDAFRFSIRHPNHSMMIDFIMKGLDSAIHGTPGPFRISENTNYNLISTLLASVSMMYIENPTAMHPYKARLISMILSVCLSDPRVRKPCSLCISVMIQASTSSSEWFHEFVMKILDFVKKESLSFVEDSTMKKFPARELVLSLFSMFPNSGFSRLSFAESIFKLLPCIVESCSNTDLDLAKNARQLLSHSIPKKIRIYSMKQSLTVKYIDDIVIESSLGAGWNGKLCAICFLQIVHVFNLQVCPMSQEKALQDFLEKRLLEETQLEVLEACGSVLAGMFASNPNQVELISIRDKYMKWASVKIPPPNKKQRDAKEDLSLKKRLAGVLGLSAIVYSAPYDIPDALPDAVWLLSRRAEDPFPIGQVAKKCLQKFRASHHDTWAEQKKKFTSEQLEDLDEGSNASSYAYS